MVSGRNRHGGGDRGRAQTLAARHRDEAKGSLASQRGGSNHHKRDRVREGNTPYRRTLWRLGDALDAFGCEDATETLCGDWHPLRGKKVNIC
jgi:hypothetical protein